MKRQGLEKEKARSMYHRGHDLQLLHTRGGKYSAKESRELGAVLKTVEQ